MDSVVTPTTRESEEHDEDILDKTSTGPQIPAAISIEFGGPPEKSPPDNGNDRRQSRGYGWACRVFGSVLATLASLAFLLALVLFGIAYYANNDLPWLLFAIFNASVPIIFLICFYLSRRMPLAAFHVLATITATWWVLYLFVVLTTSSDDNTNFTTTTTSNNDLDPLVLGLTGLVSCLHHSIVADWIEKIKKTEDTQ
jgi:hypothetical protein